MLCDKCHQKEATIHFTTVVGTDEETTDLCKDCAPPGLQDLDLEKAKAMSLLGKTCEFCGATAYSGEMLASGGVIAWCFDCGLEFAGIVAELIKAEQPGLISSGKEPESFLSLCSDSKFQAWSQAAIPKAVQILKERRQSG